MDNDLDSDPSVSKSSTLGITFSIIGLVWWIAIWCICLLGGYIAKTTFGPNVSFGTLLRHILPKYENDYYHSLETGNVSVDDVDEDPLEQDYSYNNNDLPPVSILRPLHGVDENLAENLESTFLQKYPKEKFEILFSVAKSDDASIPIAQSIMQKYPDIPCRLIIGHQVVGVNPKINNLVKPYTMAKYDILWILDSNVFVQSRTLLHSVAIFNKNPRIGLVHHAPFPVVNVYNGTSIYQDSNNKSSVPVSVPVASSSSSSASASSASSSSMSVSSSRSSISSSSSSPRSQGRWALLFSRKRPLGTQIESSFLGSTHAKMYLALNTLAIDSCVMGKSNLFRRSDLERAVQLERQKDGTSSFHNINNEDDQEYPPPPTPQNVVASSSTANESESEKDDSNDSNFFNGSPKTCAMAHFGKYLGEDNMIGRAIWHQLGMRHALTSDIAWNVLGPEVSLETYFLRRIRWIRVRKYMVIASTILEPFTESLLSGLLGSLSIKYLFGIPFLLTFSLHIILWHLLDVYIYKIITLRASSPEKLASTLSTNNAPTSSSLIVSNIKTEPLRLSAWIVRELCAFPVWVYAMCGNDIGWRDGKRTYRIMINGHAKIVSGSQSKHR